MSSTDSNSMVTHQSHAQAPVRSQPGIASDIFKLDAAHFGPPVPLTAGSSTSTLSSDKSKHAPLAIRKRFYPAQWRKVAQPKLDALANSRGLRLEWIGWERSLPRLYLPLDGLSRLMTEAVDSVTGQIASAPHFVRNSWRPISLRVSSQSSGPTCSLIVVMEHERWLCNLASQAALNSTSMFTSSEMRLDRVRRQVMSLGGMISVSQLLGGGSCMRIALPIDEPRALVKAWLDQQLTNVETRLTERKIHLFLVGRRPGESSAQLMAADQRLQSLIEPSEMVYRTDLDRWLWLRTTPQLPAFARTDAWLTSQVSAWRVQLSRGSVANGSNLLRWQLAGAIAQSMQRLIGTKVAPLDCIVHGIPKPPSAAPMQSSMQSSIKPPHQRNNSRARWRYPI